MEIKTERDLETLVRRYQEPLLRYCTGITGNREDAEDVVQTAYIKAWVKRDSQRKSGSLKSWLFRIAYNLFIDSKRIDRYLPLDDEFPLPDPSPGPEELILRKP